MTQWLRTALLLVLVRSHYDVITRLHSHVPGVSGEDPGLGRGQVDQGEEPWGGVHHHGEGGRDVADSEIHHLQSYTAAGSRGECQCTGGQSGQEVRHK